MKLSTFFLIAYVVSIFALSVFWTIENVFLSDKIFVSQLNDRLLNTSLSRSSQIIDLFKTRGADAKFLSDVSVVRDIFEDSEVVLDEDVIARHSKERVRVVLRGVENYISAHPEMSFEEFLVSDGFKLLTLKGVGENSDVFLYDASDFDGKLYGNEEKQGSQLGYMSGEDILKIGELIELNDDNFEMGIGGLIGSYEDVYERYAYFSKSAKSMSDGTRVGVGIVSESSDFPVLNAIPQDSVRYLTLFSDVKKYRNILLLNDDGNVVYVSRPDDILGSNVNWLGIGRIDHSVLDVDDGIGFSVQGPFIWNSESEMRIAFSSEVYWGDNQKGYVVLLDDFDKFASIVSDVSGLGEKGDNFLINLRGDIITSLREKQYSLFVQNIRNESLDDCLEEFGRVKGLGNGSEGYLRVEKGHIREFENDDNRTVLSVGTYIPKSNWCQITQFDKEESFSEARKDKIVTEIFIVVFSVIALSFYFLLNRYLGKGA